MSANRMHFQNTIHFITNRCEHEMLLLLPTERITEIIQCWFARAVVKLHIWWSDDEDDYGECSGALITPDAVLTAAHSPGTVISSSRLKA